MKIYPIYHSGFLVELANHYLLFDFWQRQLPLLDANKPMFVFVSHAHHDHYDPRIKQLANYYQECHFVVNGIDDPEYLQALPDKEYSIGDVIIKTLGSTDEGVAYLVEAEGKKIFHAGDLHLWYWDDDTEEERLAMYQAYRREISKLKGTKIDIAFLVCDNRQDDKDALAGIELFAQLIKPSLIVPMHGGFGINKTKERVTKLAKTISIIDITRYKVYEI